MCGSGCAEGAASSKTDRLAWAPLQRVIFPRTAYGVKTNTKDMISKTINVMCNTRQVLKRLMYKMAGSWVRFNSEKTLVHFLHVGKAGGTAIKTTVRKGGNQPEYSFPPEESVCTSSHRVFLHQHHVSLGDIPRGEKFFFFLRDPIDRFISGFCSRKRKGQPRHYTLWSADEEIAFERYRTPNELALSLSSANEAERESAVHAMQSIEHVRAHYSKWYEDKGCFLSRLTDALMVGRVEQLDLHFSQLRELLNLSPQSKLPESDEEAHRTPYSELDTHLESEARHNLRNWYAEDYSFLELCETHARQLKYPA